MQRPLFRAGGWTFDPGDRTARSDHPSTGRLPAWLRVGLVALSYAAATLIGAQLAPEPGAVAVAAPAAGIALAALLLFGYRLVPGVAIGAFLASASMGASGVAAGVEGLAAASGALVGVFVFRLGSPVDAHLGRLRDVLTLSAAALCGGTVAASLGAAGLVAAGTGSGAEYPAAVAARFFSNFLGIMVVAPMLLVPRVGGSRWSAGRRVEAVVLAGTLVLVSQAVFGSMFGSFTSGKPLAFAVIPAVIWATLRFGRRGAAGSVALLAWVAIAGTLRGQGPFAGEGLRPGILELQVFVAVLAAIGLALGAVIAERTAGRLVEREATRRELVASENTLREHQAFLEGVLENLDEAIVACDADGQLTLFNRATRELHGLPLAPLAAEQWGDYYSLYHADGTTPMERDDVPLFRALQGERVENAEMVIAPANAPPRRLLASGQVILSQTGRKLGAVVAMHDITARSELERELRHRSLHDPLTGLANRDLFTDRVQHALARRGIPHDSVAILILDLDDFKAINDRWGHIAGDQVLMAMAERLRGLVRPADTVARFGGDEFAVLLEDAKSRASALRTADRVLAGLSNPLPLDGMTVSLDASMGIALPGAAYEPAEDLIRNADVAMYRAKAQAKGGRVIFDAGMREAVLARLEGRADLEAALRRRELRVHYQPIVDLETGRTTGFEALVRWMHPARGMVAPFDFIPLAEETGLIVPIGNWVMREACHQLVRWQETFGAEQQLTVSVNISAVQIRDPGFEAEVTASLATSGLAPQLLTLEITESLLLEDPTDASDKLTALKRLGVRVAIDDFGTGYSSLGYLARLPIDVLKIDKSFVNTIGDGAHGSAVARLIVDLGTTLDLEVVAEGIEEAEQADMLRAIGCQLGQGYLFSRPMDEPSASQFITATLESRPVVAPPVSAGRQRRSRSPG